MSLMSAMATLIKIFDDYAGKDGDASTLSNSEVKALLKKEFGAKCETASEKAQCDKMFADLDANGDGKVDFTEFVTLVAALTSLIKGSM
ncbi:ictacalcin-like [Engraulis encrasicolus]|uniref:ictacalcin-like n=1 Tax=Engraulis encrasicolus TaxID=184585 RepID=UPI002FD1042B